jgi:hypothetical protein
MFWNLARFAGAPLLAAIVSGEAATVAEADDDDVLAAHAVAVRLQLQPKCLYVKGGYGNAQMTVAAYVHDVVCAVGAGRSLGAGAHTPNCCGGSSNVQLRLL